MKKILAFLENKPVSFSIVLSVIINFFIEVLARRSLFSTLAYLIENPFIFLYNSIIILFTLSVSLYFSKRYSVFTVVCFLWLCLGITNSILIGMRGTPLSAVDFTIIRDALNLVKLYVSPALLIILIILIISAISGIIFLFVRIPKIKPTYIRASFLTLLSAFFIFFTSQSLLSSDAIASGENDLFKIYKKYGFACCFSYTLLGHGIDPPPSYSAESLNKMLEIIDYTDTTNPGDTPNIIMIQLESFIDPSYLSVNGMTFSEEPVPNFKNLKERYPHGFLKVPAFGGGTANTEFEVLTQIDLKAFGLGEYPYTTALKENACESIAFNLKKNGYKTHAIHNHIATFYDRNIVYENLGFDTFTSIEYMTDLERNPLGWAKDSSLTPEILKALKKTSEKDFIFAVSVQGHGQYPSEYDGNLKIKAQGIDDAEITTNLSYYLSQIHEMDEFLKELTDTLSKYPEKTIVVFYGDHLPSLKLGEINNNQLGYYPISCDRYETEYVIWSNFPNDTKNEDIKTYKLSSKILDIAGINTGILTQLNKKNNLSADMYNAYVKMCAYDMLYGDKYLKAFESLTPTKMKLGISDITIENITISGNDAYIKGTGFTEYSVVYNGDTELETEYLSSEELLVDSNDIKRNSRILIKQKSEGKILSESNTIIY